MAWHANVRHFLKFGVYPCISFTQQFDAFFKIFGQIIQIIVITEFDFYSKPRND